MSNKRTAFPVVNLDTVWDEGMTLRDYFAAKAMPVLMVEVTKANPNISLAEAQHIVADMAYDQADAMLKKRQQDGN